MNENGAELVESIHGGEVENQEEQREQKQRQQLLVEQAHREVRGQGQLAPSLESMTLDFTELPGAKPDSPLCQEWNFYRGQVEQLLADGHEGRFVLIKGEEIIGIWGTREDAKAVALQRYLMQPCLIHQVRRREPIQAHVREVLGMPIALAGVEVLIGLDFLLGCKLVLDGPARQFSLES